MGVEIFDLLTQKIIFISVTIIVSGPLFVFLKAINFVFKISSIKI